MSDWSPPSIPRTWLLVSSVLFVLLFAYSVVILAQPLIVLVLGASIVWFYLLWRFIVAIEAIADAQQRIATQREQD